MKTQIQATKNQIPEHHGHHGNKRKHNQETETGINGNDCLLEDLPEKKCLKSDKVSDNLPKDQNFVEDILKKRHLLIGRATQIHYPDSPLYIEYGKGAYLYDENDRPYLDLMNNVAHVGHSHPKVTEACLKQMEKLCTNSRFLHDTIIDVAEKLISTLPPSLSVCFFVNSGSEANDLALQLARTYTKHHDVVVVDDAYHGHTQILMEVSPYKFKHPKGVGQKDYIHVVERPDSYRGTYQGDNNDESVTQKYADDAKKLIDDVVANGKEISMFIAEGMMSCGGQIIYPKGYLKKIYEYIHNVGGVCVADEVQVGFGRCGKKAYWAFQLQDVVPDIVTVGKPFGNGHPVSCVITTHEIAQAWEDRKINYFNTFGGNPVSMAIAKSVMTIVDEENLRENAEIVGSYCIEKLNDLKEKHMLIGDIRGVGLFIGIEISKDRTTKQPGTDEAKQIIYSLRRRGVLISRDGPDENVLKIKPPMVISKSDIDFFIQQLDVVLSETKVD